MESTARTEERPDALVSVFITDLASYNEGRLVGAWVDLSDHDEESLQEKIDLILAEGHKVCQKADLCLCAEHEEFFITDSETTIGLDIGEHDNPFDLLEVVGKWEELDEDDRIKVHYLLDHGGYDDLDDAISKADDVSYYPNTTMLELAEMFVDEGIMGDFKNIPCHYIDYDAVARDLAMDYHEIDGDIFRAD